MSIGIHDTIYFDKIERTNKLQTLVAIAYAAKNSANKSEVIEQLENSLNIFKGYKMSKKDGKLTLGSGTYVGESDQWDSKYTLSRDFGLLKGSKGEVTLSEFGSRLVEGEISPKYFISVVMLNYIQIIDNKVVNILYSIIKEMENENYDRITKKQLMGIKDFNLNGKDKNGYINGLFDILKDTYFFEKDKDNKNTLKINKEIFDINSLISIININELNNNIDEVKEKYKNQEKWCSYLSQENNKLLILLLKKNTVNNMVTSNIKKTWNRIIFGAPGTGKSHKISKDIDECGLKDSYERVTVYPGYTFSQFVGSYKPVSKTNTLTNNEEIKYELVPGPFLRVLIKALNNENAPQVLVIEEINRSNPSAVFGDIFQLLDRSADGKSKYEISISQEMKEFLKVKLGKDIDKLYIPSNMYIWATMNSADQGVYPMDSAFKRRWSFEYIGIDDNEDKLQGKPYEFISLGNKKYRWNDIRRTINDMLIDININEDKLLGPFFLSETELLESQKNKEEFDNIFKSKVLMYLYEDILKHKKNIDFFYGNPKTFSQIIKNYESGNIFSFEINEYTVQQKQEDQEDAKNSEDESKQEDQKDAKNSEDESKQEDQEDSKNSKDESKQEVQKDVENSEDQSKQENSINEGH